MGTDGSNPVSVGRPIEPSIQAVSSATLASSVGIYDKRLGLYTCFTGASASRTAWVYDVRPDDDADGNAVTSGWWKWDSINLTCAAWDDDRFIYGTSTGVCGQSRNSGTSLDYQDLRQEYVAAADVSTGSDTFTVTKSYRTGDTVKVRSTGTIPAGLTANTTYYAIRMSATSIKLATSSANALLGTAIDITTQGTGQHSVLSTTAIDAYYTTNWIKFGWALLVKKLGRPGFIFNALAQEIDLMVSVAYDWGIQYGVTSEIAITSSHEWGSGAWGSFVWSDGSTATPKNVGPVRRKCRAVRFKIRNNTILEGFNLQGMEIPYQVLRNRGNLAA
jgi:hypothetical protein